MGINESVPTLFKRRFHVLSKFVTSAYNWLNPNAFDTFEDFLNRVVFSTTRDFVGAFGVNSHEQELKVREELEEYVKQYILDNHLDEIEKYYYKRT